jgi:ureidoacrylate peracid hydrolase
MSIAPQSPPLQPEWLDPARTALLVIDVQVDFALPGGVMGRKGMDMAAPQAALARIDALVAAARSGGTPVVFVRYLNRPGEETPVAAEARARRGESDPPELCLEGTPGAAFAGPQPAADEAVITKSLFSAFAGTGLEELLKSRGRDTLVLCGLTTECCVQSTAWDAFERAFHIFLAADACAAYSPELHEGALKSLELNGAFLGAAADIAAAWEKR